MKLSFWGASRQVTGSMYLLETSDDYRILIDCGLDMERKDINPEDYVGIFPFEPSMINAVVVTHAHLDHTGFLPNLLREGFEGRIYCTHATLELTKLILEDSASLNQHRLKKIQKKQKKRTELERRDSRAKELYLQKQVDETLDMCVCVNFSQRTRLSQGVYLTFIPAGHLLGAGHVLLEIEEEGKKKRIGFSGDIGRYDSPLLNDPETMPEVDYLICESTYGSRYHQTKGSPEEEVLEVIKSTCVDVPGRLIVPAFSIGRTQAMLYTLHKLQKQGLLPPLRIFSDSPLALRSNLIYQKYYRWLNEEAQEFYQKNGALFDFENLIQVETDKQSKAISTYNEPCIIVSSSGMIQGGRIEHHVRSNLQNSYATILMIGFSAEGTFGYELMHGKTTVEINKKEVEIRARIASIDVFSGHADLAGLLKFVKMQKTENLQKLFIVHGEYQNMVAFQGHLKEAGYPQVEIPQRGQTYEL
jgi:metallo-beta-lactamase family protein